MSADFFHRLNLIVPVFQLAAEAVPPTPHVELATLSQTMQSGTRSKILRVGRGTGSGKRMETQGGGDVLPSFIIDRFASLSRELQPPLRKEGSRF